MMQLTNVRKTWQPFVSNKEPFQAIERAFGFGFGGTAAHNCIAAYSKDYSLASNLQAKQHMASRSSRVIPANNPPHSCKYSTGVSQYNTMEMQLQLPV